MQVTEAARAARADLIVTVGGGSISDGAKAVQMCLANGIRSPDAIDMLRSAFTDHGQRIVCWSEST
jgi:maleylacetate reductase